MKQLYRDILLMDKHNSIHCNKMLSDNNYMNLYLYSNMLIDHNIDNDYRHTIISCSYHMNYQK